ncbi:uncharacterized protein [Procambarus clarkii]|uniref:uncharacterized protein n=1 Tax=Procambarus clarkii TaxID=6728 RepID=UPI001E675C97|nr:uncharacterized protein LOC123765180 [Procambarus clarkii]
MSQRPSSGASEVGNSGGEGGDGVRAASPSSLVLPQLPCQAGSSTSTRTPPSRTSARGTSPSGKRRISTTSSVASGTSLASLLVKLHQPPHSSLSVEGKLKIRATVDCGSDVLFCKFSPDGSVVGAALRSGQVKFFTQAGMLSNTLQLPGEVSAVVPTPATSLLWLPGAQPEAILTAYSDGRVVAWCGRGVGVVQDTGGVDVRAAVVMGGVDTQVVTFTRDEVTVRDAHTLNPITTMDQGVGGQLIARGSLWAVTGRGRELVGGGGSGLTWWDARTGSVTRRLSGVQVRGPALAWHPHANRVVSGSWGGGPDSVKVWEASTGRLTHLLHSDSVNTCVYSTVWAGKEVVAVGGADPNLLRLATLDNTTVGVLRGVRNTVWAVDAILGRGHQGTRLALASGPTLYILDVLK